MLSDWKIATAEKIKPSLAIKTLNQAPPQFAIRLDPDECS